MKNLWCGPPMPDVANSSTLLSRVDGVGSVDVLIIGMHAIN
jgi:hypothetical protein